MDAGHIPVLLHECIDNLNIRPDGIYVDGTLGMGGHSEQIAGRLTTGTLIGIDRDETAIARAGARLAPFGERVQLVHGAQQRAVAAEHQQHVRALGPRSRQHRVPILTQKMPGALAQRQRGRIRTIGIQQKLHTAPRYP